MGLVFRNNSSDLAQMELLDLPTLRVQVNVSFHEASGVVLKLIVEVAH